MDLMMPPRVESGLGSLYLSLLYQIPILPIIPNSIDRFLRADNLSYAYSALIRKKISMLVSTSNSGQGPC